MKKNLLFTISLLMLTVCLFAQNSVTLNINHKLSDADFAMNLAAKNNIKHDFNVTRLQYYISEISIIHDSGVETAIDNLWILVDAGIPTNVDLGSHDINNVEMIKLHIGVNSEVNHDDPSSFANNHPLAPKFPSMHWGWNPGYRFVAIEGNGGTGLNQLFQLHGLGDSNYFTTSVELESTASNNQININLDADYTRALENIALTSGVIVHGDNLQAKECLENFRDFVFSEANIISPTININELAAFDVYPNPTTGTTSLLFEADNFNLDYQLSVTTIDGKQVKFFNTIANGKVIDFQNYNSGMYFVNLIKDGQVIKTKKLIVK